MDNFSQIWQRVQETPPTDGDGIPALIAQNLTQAQIYRRLSGQHTGICARMLRELSAGTRSHAQCLDGIYRLIYEESAGAKPYSIPEEPESITLRRCYGEHLRMQLLYKSHYADPQFGTVYRILLEESEQCCRLLLTVIGMQP